MPTRKSTPRKANDKPKLHPTQKQVLDAFRVLATGPDQRAVVSDRLLATMTGRPHRTVQYTVRTLVRDGHIEIVDHVGPRLNRVVRILNGEK